jgi:hypothetical protein
MDSARLQCLGIHDSQLGCSAAGDEDAPVARYHPSRACEAVEAGYVTKPIVIDNL